MGLVTRMSFAAAFAIGALSLACLAFVSLLRPDGTPFIMFVLGGVGAALLSSAITWYAVRPSDIDVTRRDVVVHMLVRSFGTLSRHMDQASVPTMSPDAVKAHVDEVRSAVAYGDIQDLDACLACYERAAEAFRECMRSASAKNHPFDHGWSKLKGEFMVVLLAVAGVRSLPGTRDAMTAYAAPIGRLY